MKNVMTSEKQGAILVIVMMLVVVFSLMTLALLQLGSLNEIETVQNLRTLQAHWLAEAGLERNLSWVVASQTYRDGLPASEPGSSLPFTELETGEYTLQAWAPAADEIIIKATGTTTNGSLDESATVQLSLRYASGIPGAIIGLNTPGHTYINDDVIVLDGSIYRNGTMEIEGEIDEDYSAYATSPPIDGDGDFTENYIPEPEVPVVDPTGRFASLLTAASTQTNTTFDGTLSGTIYINGDLTLPDGVSGSGTLVVYGDVIFDGNKKSVADNIEIVAEGNITINQHTSFGDDVEIFSEDGNISLAHDVDGGTVALIAKNGSLGHIEVDYNNTLGSIDEDHLLSSGHDIGDQNPSKPSFSGIFYAGYDIVLQHKADFYGSIIAGRHMDIGASSSPGQMSITYDPSVFDEDWEFDFGNEIVILNSDWQEL